MSKSAMWKEIRLDSESHYLRLQSAIGSMDAGGYIVVFENAVYIIQTNMPYSVLRRWFRFVDVPLPGDIGISSPTWEAYDSPDVKIGRPGVYYI